MSAWEPVLVMLGLVPRRYEAAEPMMGKAPQKGSLHRRRNAASSKTTPTWNFLMYTILSRVPGHRLKLNTLYMLCLAWCPDLGPDNKRTNGSCRHNLQTSLEFTQDRDSSPDLGDWHRIATTEEYEDAKLRETNKRSIVDSRSLVVPRNSKI